MHQSILHSEGQAIPSGFVVLGQYQVGEDQPPWGWRTEYSFAGPDQLSITAFNISPTGEEAKAVETSYQRIAD